MHMSDRTNTQRAARFADVLAASGYDGGSSEASVRDLLTDCEHYLRLTLGFTRRAERTTLVAIARRMADIEQRDDDDGIDPGHETTLAQAEAYLRANGVSITEGTA